MAIFLSSNSDEECYKILSKDLFLKDVTNQKEIQNAIIEKVCISNDVLSKLSVNQIITNIVMISKLLANQLDNQTTVDKLISFVEYIAKEKVLNASDRNFFLNTLYFTLRNTYQKSYFIEYFEEAYDSLSQNDSNNYASNILRDYLACDINIIKIKSLIRIINVAINNSCIPLLEVLGDILKNSELSEKIKLHSDESLLTISKLKFLHINIKTNISELLSGLSKEQIETQLLESIQSKDFESLLNNKFNFSKAEILKTCQAICLNNMLYGKDLITFDQFESDKGK